MNNFGEWLLTQLKTADLSQSELSRAVNVTTAQMSRIISGQRSASNETLISIAHALHLPPELIFEKAGILPPKHELSTIKRAAISSVENADDDDVEFIYKWLTERKEHKNLTLQPRPQK